MGVGGAIGLPAAALIADHADWHVLFWISAGLGAIAAMFVLRLIPESQVRTGGRFDLVGAVGLAAVLVCLLLGISKGTAWGWSSGRTIGLLVAAVVVLLAWGWWELRTRQPLVDLRTSARRQVLLTNLSSAMFGFAMFGMSLVLPQLLQLPTATGYGLGQTMLAVGLVLAPQGLVMMVVSRWSARIGVRNRRRQQPQHAHARHRHLRLQRGGRRQSPGVLLKPVTLRSSLDVARSVAIATEAADGVSTLDQTALTPEPDDDCPAPDRVRGGRRRR